ncbi:hypothetical protein EVAR_63364_1 [Eumeta japonica]|uniref:Uncharacterized protein n=1 Tax=Eumeta variegata TaxID=151549 RepID=A0A4C1ZTX1_EUMVA|nr:hypothetical protein EVAR_63364_1 [Eumeta japonica]
MVFVYLLHDELLMIESVIQVPRWCTSESTVTHLWESLGVFQGQERLRPQRAINLRDDSRLSSQQEREMLNAPKIAVSCTKPPSGCELLINGSTPNSERYRGALSTQRCLLAGRRGRMLIADSRNGGGENRDDETFAGHVVCLRWGCSITLFFRSGFFLPRQDIKTARARAHLRHASGREISQTILIDDSVSNSHSCFSVAASYNEVAALFLEPLKIIIY